jgi:hypothetical protein
MKVVILIESMIHLIPTCLEDSHVIQLVVFMESSIQKRRNQLSIYLGCRCVRRLMTCSRTMLQPMLSLRKTQHVQGHR